MKHGTVFCFTVHFAGDSNYTQKRYVLANTEAEAYEKIDKYTNELNENGFDDLVYNYNPLVEVENVIY